MVIVARRRAKSSCRALARGLSTADRRRIDGGSTAV
jgi:hypothetical protein